ncbi:7TM-DISM domain-containing protein [Dyadobacter sp. CY347]|uniref:7TM-DISM domain-containing protein n=1 Tax=Dyadobacter sp. CY347 TaxID=2909336 RepID=UPI001F43149C|nr:7TM-DISM domain-containing protein [Dyadobacter sp. CY347]MCF2490837.1 7TM-DISM domain-containing protein [Dyadobacter sp. CY347]
MQEIDYVAVRDQGYRIEQILDGKGIGFKHNDSLLSGYNYWFKIIVNNPYHAEREYVVRVWPFFRNVIYHTDLEHNTWKSDTSGAFTDNVSRLAGRLIVKLAAQSTSTMYIRMGLSEVTDADPKFKPKIEFCQKAYIDQHEQAILRAWIVSMAILIVFFLINLNVYLTFRDNSVLYYLLIQIGGMLYITGYRFYFQVPFPRPIFSFALHEVMGTYDLNRIFTHVGIVFVLYGLVQLTRSYLNTSQALPGLDKVLRYSLYSYIVLSAVAMVINMNGFQLEYYTLVPDNIFCMAILAMTLVTCIIGFIRKIPSSGYFLAAQILPMLCLLAMPIYHIFVSLDSEKGVWIAEIAIVSQAFAFSMALIARTKAIQNSLLAKEIDNKQLEFELKEVGYLNKVNQLELEKMNMEILSEKSRNELLRERLETNQRELASSTLYMVQKNELLNHLKLEVDRLSKPHHHNTSRGLRDITSLLENNIQLDTDWNKFKIHFEQVHPDFFENLKISHPNLTLKEVRLYAYFHMKLSHKEIATLLNIDPASVRRAKTRLYKKLALQENE